ncbi:hypothetical protein ACTI_69310 [Actinoplanes sp. OR16]|uniref:hypothetical protein n=1 Tax=Actinoplanes sp. OR16 TaxID=946334 RepID=UPI000F6D5500|nr:hypothetical protein [Actinoplanes sp. OR16]BBH70246.1 hypothetical protein ACTI_69310 [Actinoplanes sp. OR16]
MIPSTRQNTTGPLACVMVTVLVLVDRGADPTIALGSLVALVTAVGRLTRG